MITLVHPSKELLLTQFNLKFTEIESSYNALLTCNTVTDIDDLFIGDTVSFYYDNELILESNIVSLEDGVIVSSADFSLSSASLTSDKIVFYNATNIRVALDFNLRPGANFETDTHSVVLTNITHYQNYSEILI